MFEVIFVVIGMYLLIKIMDKIPGETGFFKH